MSVDGLYNLLLQKYPNFVARFGRLAKKARWEKIHFICIHLLSIAPFDRATLQLMSGAQQLSEQRKNHCKSPSWRPVCSPEEKRNLVPVKDRIFHSSNMDRQAAYFQSLSPEQMQQIPLESCPRYMLPFLAWKLRSRKFHAAINHLSGKELNSSLEFCQKLKLSRLEFALFVNHLWNHSEEKQAPLIEQLTRQLFYRAQARELLDFPRELLRKNFAKIYDPNIQSQLIRSLDPESICQAVEIWNPFLSTWSIIPYDFPVEKAIAALENPVVIAELAKASAGFFAKELIPSHNPNGWIVREMLDGLEKNPWKIWLVLDWIDLEALSKWEGGQENPRIKWPLCFQAIDWYQGKSKDMRNKLETLTTFAAHNQWRKAWELVQSFDDAMCNYLFSAIRLHKATPHIMALSKPLFVAALFDDKARTNMRRAIQRGQASDGSFIEWADLIEELLADNNLPEEARRKITSLPEKVRLAVSLGGKGCPLSDQYDNPDLSDARLKIGSKVISVHSVLLRLDPFFRPYLDQLPIIAIPSDKANEAKLRLKWLYNQLTFRELVHPTTQKLLQKTSKLHLSLRPLYNNPGTHPDIIVHGCDDLGGIPAHRFILASALPFFAALFRNPMKDSVSPDLRLANLTHSQVEAVMQFVYIGQTPNFVDQASQSAYNMAWDYFNAI
ncbi:MAG: BTB/POZ domain-containing protein [Parachlamydia sp.]|nr:BTB/POZ domain-containing protein [Parachlamydia sp.]